MTEEDKILEEVVGAEYRGFTTDVENDTIPKGLNEDVSLISRKRRTTMVVRSPFESFRIVEKMEEPDWANIKYKKPNYQDIIIMLHPSKERTQKFRRARP